MLSLMSCSSLQKACNGQLQTMLHAESPSEVTCFKHEPIALGDRQAESVVPSKQVVVTNYSIFPWPTRDPLWHFAHQSPGKHSSFWQQVQPVWRVKRRSALDRHAAFIKRLERQRLAREKSTQASA